MPEAKGSEQKHEAGILIDTRSRPKRKRFGEPTSLTVLNKFKERADGNLASPTNPLNLVKVGGGCDICMVRKKKGRGSTRGLGVEMKREQSEDGKLDVVIHPTKMDNWRLADTVQI